MFSAIGFGSILLMIVASAMLERVVSTDAPEMRQEITEQKRQLLDIRQFVVDPNSGLTAQERAYLLSDVSRLEVSVLRTEEVLESIEGKTIFALISETVSEAQEAQLFLLGLFGLFIGYVCGEFCLAFGKLVCTGLRKDQIVWARRTASIAKLENAFLTTEYQAQQSLLTVLFGNTAIIMFAAMLELYSTASPMPDWSTAATALFFILAIPITGQRIARYVGEELDLILATMSDSEDALKKPNATTKEHETI